MKTSILLLLAVAVAAFAQTQPPPLAPQLAPLAQKRQAGLDALKAQDEAAIARLSKAYLDALVAAEKSATTAGQLKTVAAVNDERQSMKDGLEMPEIFPAGLPSTLKIPRQTYLGGLKKITADGLEHQQRLNADYLRNLATLAAGAPANSELAKQIAAEKEAVLQNATTSTSPAAGTPTGTNKIVNGNFTDAGADGFPKGWCYRKSDTFPKADQAPPPSLTIKAMEENKETFVRVTFANSQGELAQAVEIPSRAKEVVLRFHVRGKLAPKSPDILGAGSFYTKDKISNRATTFQKWVGKISPNAWHSFEIIGKVPAGAIFVVARLGYWSYPVTGTFDFQRVEVKFR